MSTVQSIERAFSLLKVLAGGPAGVTEIAERVSLPKSTVSRLLATLEELGVVEQVSAGGVYRMGAAMLDLAGAASPGRSLISVARPHLAELNRLTGEAAGLSIADGTQMFYLDQITPVSELQVRDWTGTRIPMHAVPSGQVVLAAMNADELDAYLAEPLTAFTDHTIADADALRARLREARTTGYAIAVDEYADGLSSIAAPIRDAAGRVLGALHVYGPTYRFHAERDPKALGALVVDAAARVRID